MGKILYILSFIAFCNAVFPQSNNFIPKIIPPNLDANALGTYDKQNVNLSTGAPEINFLLHSCKIGDLELPIKLQYDASGIKVDQMATNVGLGWSITNTGVLSQMVKDKIDGKSNNIIKQYLNSQTIAERERMLYNHQYSTIPYTGDDLETDDYNINYFGNAIDFFYNYNNNTYITQQKEDIQITKNANTWKVKLGDGTNLNFDNQNSNKSIVSILYEKRSSQHLSQNNSPVYNDTWYLTSIENKGQLANLKYINSSYVYCSKGNESYESISVIKNFENTKLISEIQTSSERITFEYSAEREDLGSLNNKASLLKFIKVYNSNNILIKQFQLYYDYYNETGIIPTYAQTLASDNYKYKRLRLKEIKRLNLITNQYENFYSFYYNSNELPNRFSASQDLWGYYNGKQNGDYILSLSELKDTSIISDLSSKGLLTKIKYPTGGTTEYFYESNKSLKPLEYNVPNEAKKCIDKITTFAKIENKYVGNGTYKFPFTVTNTMVAHISYSNYVSGCTSQYLSSDCDYSVSIEGNNTSIPLYNGQLNNIVESTITLPTGDYYIMAKSRLGNNETPEDYESPLSFMGKIMWKEEVSNKEILIGGQRIKKIISNDSFNTITQEFKYENPNGESSGTIFTAPICLKYNQSNNNLLNEVYYPLSKFNGQNLVYTRVEKIHRDNLNISNGKSVQYFSRPNHQSTYKVFPYPCPNNYKHTYGQLIKEDFFEFKNNIYNLIEENTFSYSYPSNCIENNNCITLIYGLSYADGLNNNDSLATINNNFNWGLYWLESSPFKLVSKMNKKFYGNLILNTQEYMNYDSYNHNNLTSKTTLNSDESVLTTKYSYAHEMANQPMIDANMISIPLKTETFRNGSLVSSQETNYNPVASANNVILPTSILAKKGTQSNELKLTYDSYDNKGNLTQYTAESGIPIAIIYGYHQTLPIAKIENATYADVAGYVAALQSASDAGTLTQASFAQLRNGLPNAMITTYTHKPLVGVSSIMDPKREVITYVYDGFNRLEKVIDAQGNTVSENKYNYRPQ